MKKKYTKPELKLAVDWALGKVTHAEVCRQLKKSSIGTYIALSLMLREVIQNQ